jgi:hypothetical protein
VTTVLASGASARYGYWLLNLIGSLHANSRGRFDDVIVYDLGLTPFQLDLARGIRGVEVRTVPPFAPYWREGRAWKTWIWRNVGGDRILWLDAGMTVLRPLHEVLAQIDERGYFVVSQGHALSDSIPSDYYERFALPRELGNRDAIAAGVVGFARGSEFDERVLAPTYGAAAAGFSRGFSVAELEKLNTGLDRTEEPIVRDCKLFRHEQTLLGIHFYKAFPAGVVNDLDVFAGWRSNRDHPQQVLWSHRRRGDYAYLPRVPYVRGKAAKGVAFGVAHRAQWWYLHHRWLLRPATYANKLRTLFGR